MKKDDFLTTFNECVDKKYMTTKLVGLLGMQCLGNAILNCDNESVKKILETFPGVYVNACIPDDIEGDSVLDFSNPPKCLNVKNVKSEKKPRIKMTKPGMKRKREDKEERNVKKQKLL